MAVPKKPQPAFEVLLDGKGVYPERVPLRSLSRALAAVQRLAVGHGTPAEDEDSGETPFGLLQVRRGSAVYQFATQHADAALANLRATGRVLGDPEQIGDREFILSPLDDLSAVAKSLRVSIVLKAPGKGGEVYATIRPDSYRTVADQLLVSGETTVFGKVERVGGAVESKCAMRLDERAGLLHCRVPDPRVARSLGERLYQRVAARGAGQWVKTTWRMLSFTIAAVSQPSRRPASEVIAAVRAAGGSDWDRIDNPQSFLAEVTGAQ